ncbi:MAG: YbhB/YbcL family Raf kinase inhibitor-like protein [Thermoanaerobaculia bacterium]
MALTLHSENFSPGGEIPVVFTCQGEDRSPHIAWRGAPEATRSFALIVDDPDAPDPRAPRMTWVHWVLFNIPADIVELPEGAAGDLPSGVGEGINDWKRTGYGGPCPPVGRHRYVFKLYALDTALSGLDRPTKEELLEAVQGHILERAQLIGTYEKQG